MKSVYVIFGKPIQVYTKGKRKAIQNFSYRRDKYIENIKIV